MRSERLVTARPKVFQPLVKRFSDRRTGRVEDPCTLRAAPTAKARLVYPHHFALHSEEIIRTTHLVEKQEHNLTRGHPRITAGTGLPKSDPMQGSRFPSSADPQEKAKSENFGEGNNMEILTAGEVAAILKISKRQVYELAKGKG